jgi:carbon monoxide dehydrogenase subunit G
LVELEHHFEVPAGIDKAWTHLLDMEKIAACFPGAVLSTSDGDEYTGTVKVKLGPIQLTYAGAARIVAVDEASHTATIEASGSATRSSSTARMTVVATATAVDDRRTAVAMQTDLTITGRPAQFGRGVMAEVGSKILGNFASCLSSTLADLPECDADAAMSTDAANAAAGSPTTGGIANGTRVGSHSADRREGAESIDLLGSARGAIVKRLVPVAAGLVLLLLWRAMRGRRRTAPGA